MKYLSKIGFLAVCILAIGFTACSDDEESGIAVTGVRASLESVTLEIGQEQALAATIEPSNATVQRYSWESSDKLVANVTNAGVVTGLTKGTANIILKTPRDGFTDTVKVTVRGPVVKVTGVSLDKTAITVKVGSTGQLTASVKPADATDKAVTWSTENQSIATVNSSGVVTGVTVGNTRVTATTADGGYKATAEVTVLAADIAVTGITLNKNKLELMEGDSEKLTVTIAPANATNQKVNWKSDDESIAKVDANGLVTAIAPGETRITAATEDGGFEAQAEVTVSEAKGIEGTYIGVVTMNGTPAGANAPVVIQYTSETTVSIDANASVMGGMLKLHVHGDALSITFADGIYTISGDAITDDFGYGPKSTKVDGTIDENGKIYLHLKITSITEKVEYNGQKK